MPSKRQGNQNWFGEFQRLNNEAGTPSANPTRSQSPSPKTPGPPLPSSKSDRRNHQRFEVDDAEATLFKEGLLTKIGLGKSNKAHYAMNLSEGGVAVLLTERLVPGTRVCVRIEIDKYKDTIEATANIRWCRQSTKRTEDFHAGVEFIVLKDAQRRKIGLMRKCFKATPDTRVKKRKSP